MDLLALDAFVFLSAAVLAVIVTRLFGLGSVVGYIVAGVVIGPVLHVADLGSSYLEHFSEFGIVMMLFVIGLEIDPQTIWRLRNRLIGLGGLQVVLTVAAVAAISLLAGFSWQEGVLFGCLASLSSTAIVLQTMEEKALLQSDGGRASFAVLLFQDLAVIPMLAIFPLLSAKGAGAHVSEGPQWIADLPPWAAAIATLAAICLIVGLGHYLSRPLFRLIARLRLREMFTASALLLVVSIVILMSAVGLSPALGAFLAGVVLANSEFKHELQSDIEPFKGLLLGLFFMTIGAKVEPQLLLAHWPMVLGLVLLLCLVKAAVLYPLAWLFRLPPSACWLFALGLAQAGEFGFVLLSLARERAIIPQETVSILILAITVSMVVTPALFLLYERIAGALDRRSGSEGPTEPLEEGPIIIAGVGRFGQVVNRILLANGHRPVVLDYRAEMVDTLRKFGIKSFFGDAGRPDLLMSAGLANARLLIVAVDDPERAEQIVTFARGANPSLRIIARAYDRLDHPRLLEAGADHAVRELFGSSIEVAGLALRELGVHPYEAEKRIMLFARHDDASIRSMAHLLKGHDAASDSPEYVARFESLTRSIEAAIMSDRRDQYEEIARRGWTPPNLPEE